MDNQEMELISTSEIVAKYGVARKTITRWIKREKIVPVYSLSGPTGAHLFSATEVEEKFGNWKKKDSEEE